MSYGDNTWGLAVLLGAFMASLSYLLNNWFLQRWGNLYLITAGPFIEEASKSYLAWQLGVPLLAVHTTFGLIEGFYEFVTSSRGAQSAILSIVGHSVFGAVTFALLRQTGRIDFAILAGACVHIGYNLWIVFRLTRNGR